MRLKKMILATLVVSVICLCLGVNSVGAIAPPPVYGDVNCDNEINSTDVTLLKRYLLGTEENVFLLNCDVDLSGDVNSTDLVILKRYVMNIIEELPYVPIPQYKLGDVNGDGVIDSTDYTLIERYILNIINDFPYEYGKLAADVDQDGDIDRDDLNRLKPPFPMPLP